FVRVSDKPIRLRSQVYEPDYLLIIDPTLSMGFDVFKGFKEGGIAIINSEEEISLLGLKKNQKAFFVPANKIAQELMGRPLGNMAILGAFSGITGLVKIDSLMEAIKRRFSGKVAQQNLEIAKRGYAYLITK
ncbi:MAG: 2-oxoacid:acceptor oxidoreductase family protein, partial [Candidatus Omnitrophota bacterium]